MLLNNARALKILREALVLAAMVVGILAARSTMADHYYVPSGSMEYTLIAGDRVFVDKRAYGFRIPFTTIALGEGRAVQRGDVVIFDSPEDGTRLIKRIVAVGGDEVVIHDGHLAINGNWLAIADNGNIELIGGKNVHLNLEDGGGPAVRRIVEKGRVLALGDHRGRSRDGRYFGTVSEDAIYGRAVAIYYRRGDQRAEASGSGFMWREL